jgi:formylglycine-generating enzyme required for sulfatase activity
MRWGARRAAFAAAVLAGAAGACGLFPDLGGLTANDASTESDAPGADVTTNDSSTDAGGDDVVSSQPDADATAPACPSGRGPAMVKLDPHACIDTTEVTVAQYREFVVAVDGGAFPQPPECSFNGNDFTPAGGMPGTSKNANPIADLNWCQAWAFCAWAGKSLCGTFDGGAVPFVGFTNSAQSVWMSACSADGTQSYPYGAVFEAGACNLGLVDANAPVAPVASYTQCVGSLPGLFDMVGNVKEWENSCQPAGTGDAAADQCRRRGAGFDEKGNGALKTCAWDETDTRDHQSFTSGVRCCAIVP